MVIDEKIKDFLIKVTGAKDIDVDSDIFASHLVNSMFAMELVLFIEKEFNIHIENEDLDLDNFRTIRAMENLIKRKQAETQ